MESTQSIWYENGHSRTARYFTESDSMSDNVNAREKENLYYTIKKGGGDTIHLTGKEMRFVYHMLEDTSPGFVSILNSRIDRVTGVRIVRLLTVIKDRDTYRSSLTINTMNM